LTAPEVKSSYIYTELLVRLARQHVHNGLAQ